MLGSTCSVCRPSFADMSPPLRVRRRGTRCLFRRHDYITFSFRTKLSVSCSLWTHDKHVHSRSYFVRSTHEKHRDRRWDRVVTSQVPLPGGACKASTTVDYAAFYPDISGVRLPLFVRLRTHRLADNEARWLCAPGPGCSNPDQPNLG